MSVATSFYKTENIDMSDPKLVEAWKDLTNEKSPTNWILVGFIDKNTEKLEVVEVGTSGLKGLRAKLKADNSRVYFGALGVSALDKRGSMVSKRPKFIAFSMVGSGCTEMQRANRSDTKRRTPRGHRQSQQPAFSQEKAAGDAELKLIRDGDHLFCALFPFVSIVQLFPKEQGDAAVLGQSRVHRRADVFDLF